ncbi:hypothetical protein AGMMS49992_04240 [Clostridia bacterium]|nr:hypothetical protein AGMMS49992_04240 [Clostridia bacterium]
MKPTYLSYAQIQEDISLLSYLHDINNGFYLDIGANDPQRLSVTKMFYDHGWHGINIEPLPDMHAKLKAARPRDISIRAATGVHDGQMSLHVDGVLSSFIPTRGKKDKVIKVSVRNVTNLLREYIDLNTQPIHFCKIDVEGFEKETLQGFDFQVLRPWIFVIEANKGRDGLTARQLWGPILTSNGYKLSGHDKLNDYYVDVVSHPELITSWWNPQELRSHYDIKILK